MEKPALPPTLLQEFWRRLRKPLELELARGCPDTAIAGMSIGGYAQAWSERLPAGETEDRRLALSIARGLRDYQSMAATERRRRAMAAVDLLRQRESPPPSRPAKSPPPPRRAVSKQPERPPQAAPTLPVGHELLAMPIDQLAPRARWPKLLTKLQLYTVRDLLYHIPREWIEIRRGAEIPDATRVAVVGVVALREYERLKSTKAPQPLYKYTLTLHDDDGAEIWVTSITMETERARGEKRAWSLNKLPFTVGQRVLALGRVDRAGRIIDLHMEDIFHLSEAEAVALRPGAAVPIYPLTNGVYQNQVQRAVLRVLAALGTASSTNALIDPLPEDIREQYALLPLVETFHELHRPHSPQRHELARKRLAFEEFLTPQLILARRRWEQHHLDSSDAFSARESLPALVARLAPFPLTGAQQRVLTEIEEDLRGPRPMNRLLQGDVGSGKTLVAAGALAFAVRSGAQAAIMAPTEILAEQLYLVLSRLLKPLEITPVLLTGNVPAAERRVALTALATGQAPIAVGTHALIQEGVLFKDLGLAIIDEQHRFGVQQRASLRQKGRAPNTLVMSATPIPRTLTLSLYGDLDQSVLDELPPGRRPVETRWLASEELSDAYDFIRAQVAQGRQAYVLCPLVEQSELLQADAAVEMAAELQRHIFPRLKIGLLHGRMRPEEKEAAMEDFRAGRTHILACTTVIEVGVDVSNASVMLIHNAERFGLAQLHQLRGRVGRAEHQSTCILVTHSRFNPTAEGTEDSPARKRLRIMLTEQDGFRVAEADLEIRGPGEYFGTRQSGLLDFQIGSLTRDVEYLEFARQAAHAIINADPDLKSPPYTELRQRVVHLKAKVDQFRE